MIEKVIETVGMVAGITLPLFNIPLILKIIKRQSSQDISICWVLGVWVCILLMAPSGFTSDDIVWKTYNYANVVLFSFVAIVTLKYRKGPQEC